jgi:hypothetical protein
MGWLLQILMYDNFSAIRLFKFFSIGIIHPSPNVKGILFGIWKFQIQLVSAYEDKVKIEGEGYA